ncbi:DUF2971 domain-containing protein [Dysgonomonas capnocytophagoides]|uniref:DUF2971 domain-containing protein n=1 Tax=Dysgonomonas capnocytophagoides TaxID=45254 RepID=UPI000404683E|nr:DUF2971 domain-containing protein [Dysgonomonas capnocytophagoides]
MKKAYKYRGGIGVFDKEGQSIFERDINTLTNNQIYLPTKVELNDPTEGFYNDSSITSMLSFFNKYSEKVKEQYNGLIDKFSQIGIYSLSNNIDNELLWAYYGSGHTGFAIEYDIDLLKESLNHNRYFQFIFDFDVDYVKKISKAGISILQGGDINDTLKIYLGSKSLSWEHEKEYRLIIEGKGLFDIDYRAVTGIYFGYRMQDEEIDFIMSELRGRNLKYYKMDLIEYSYKFRPKEILDKYIDSPKYIVNNLSYNIEDLLITEDFLGKEAYAYKDKLIEAIERVKYEPLINEIYIATIGMDSGEPIFKIFTYTNSGIPPTKAFFFKLGINGELIKIDCN